MRILFTGATGVIGDEAVPLLVAAGHDVDAVARTDDQRRRLAALGANPVSVDLFDPRAVAASVSRVDAVVHMATAIPPQHEMTKRSSWHLNDRLRVEATRLLVDAALDARVERFVQQSVSLVYADGGDRWLEETAAVAPVWHVLDSALTAESEVSRLSATGRAGVVLRLSSLYGSGRTSAEHLDAIANRRLPRVGRGENFVSRVHVGDAASSIVAAIEAPAGIYNVSDGHPVRAKDELELLAELLGARAPRTVPRWLARRVVGPAANLLSISQRVSAARFRDVTGWSPVVESSTEGWGDVISASSPRATSAQAAVRA